MPDPWIYIAYPKQLDDTPKFRQSRIRRTKTGLVCYFCDSTYDENGAYAACCIAASEWNVIVRKANQHRLLRQNMRER
jgi:hypothetical protein